MTDFDDLVAMIMAHLERRAAFIAEDEAACLACGEAYPAPGLAVRLTAVAERFTVGDHAEGLRRYVDHLHETDSSMRAEYFTLLRQFAAHLGVDAAKLDDLRPLDG